MGDFIQELDTLLSSIPKHGFPILILGDMNIYFDNPSCPWYIILTYSRFAAPQLTKSTELLASF